MFQLWDLRLSRLKTNMKAVTAHSFVLPDLFTFCSNYVCQRKVSTWNHETFCLMFHYSSFFMRNILLKKSQIHLHSNVVNVIFRDVYSNQGGRLCPPHYYRPLRFFDDAASLMSIFCSNFLVLCPKPP